MTSFIKKTTITLQIIHERKVDEHKAMTTTNSDSRYVESTYTSLRVLSICSQFFTGNVVHTPL